MALGDDFESANAAVMYHARDIVVANETGYGQTKKEYDALHKGDEATKLWAENWFDGLTYCKYHSHCLRKFLRLTMLRYLERAWSAT